MALFNKILTKGGQHPLATQRGLETAIAELPLTVRKEALRKAADWFESLDSPALSSTQKLDILLSLDTAVHECQTLLWLRVRGSRAKDFAFVSARTALIEYAAAFSQQVDRLINSIVQSADTEIIKKDDLFVLAGRSLRALDGWKRARHLDDEIMLPEIWSRLFVVLRFGFQSAAETRDIRLYEDEEPSTLQREFLRAVMLDTLPLTNLTWRQIEIMHTVLDHFSGHFLLRAEPGQLTPYFLNLTQKSGPQHASRMPAPTGAVFLGPGAAFPEIVQLFKQISAERHLPDWLTLPDRKPAEVIKALAFTIRHWSRTPPERKSGRRGSTGLIQVVHGFQPARVTLGREDGMRKSSTHVVGYAANNPIFSTERLSLTKVKTVGATKTAHDHVETWEIVDESPTGIGAVPAIKPATLLVGALLGCFRTREKKCQLAVTRRTSHDSKNRFLVGMQFIVGEPHAACIGVRANPSGSLMADEDVAWHDAIVLVDQNRVLFKRDGFAPGMIALVQIGDKEKLHSVKLIKCEEAYTDCDCWTFLPATQQDWQTARALS